MLSQRLGLEAPQNLSLQAKSKAESEAVAVAVAVAKTKAKAKAQTSEDSLVQPAESEQDTLLPLLASDTTEPVGNLLGVYAQAPQSTTSDSDDDRAGLLTSPNTSPLAGPNVGPITGPNAVTSSQMTGSAAFAPLLFSPGLGLLGASAALVALDNTNSNSQPAPEPDTASPNFTSGASVEVRVPENALTTTVVHTAKATDNVGVAAYAFESGGADNNKFSLNTTTGALTFLSSPDFEAPGSAAGTNTYTVRVKAVDAAGNSAVQTVTITVTDLDDTAPVFTAGGSASATVAENILPTTVVHTAKATDNVGVTAYSFEAGGADNAKFNLNPATGALTFRSSPDFEAPGSAAGSNTYSVKVKALDAAGNSAVQTITVNVSDLNEAPAVDNTAPVFTAGGAISVTLSENIPNTTVVHTAAATDNVGVTAYAFEAGGADNNKFSLNTATGALTFLSSPNYEAPASAEGNSTYVVKVKALDAAGNS
ncbi:MAG: cadherin repeat domain-containing protein, partial [Limnohabitans sp.]